MALQLVSAARPSERDGFPSEVLRGNDLFLKKNYKINQH